MNFIISLSHKNKEKKRKKKVVAQIEELGENHRRLQPRYKKNNQLATFFNHLVAKIKVKISMIFYLSDPRNQHGTSKELRKWTKN